MKESDEPAEPTVEELESLAPGEEPTDPYDETDVSALPAWWTSAIEEFEENDLKTYQPSRLRDGSITETITSELAEEYNVEIRLAGKNVEYGDTWRVLVDGVPIADVGHHRSPAGYSVFDIDAEELERAVRAEVC